MALLPFAQLDLPGELPLSDGRYLAREPGAGEEPDSHPDVLVVRTLGAPRVRPKRRRGRPVPVDPAPEATPLKLTRITLIKALPLDSEAAAEEWLARVQGDHELASGLARDVAYTANRALLAHRVAAPDIYAHDIEPGSCAAIRFGYGAGEEVAESRWSAAFELPEDKRGGFRAQLVDGVGAQERVAAVLGGRDQVGAHEVLLVDAELAEAEGRLGLAVIRARAALEVAARRGGDTSEAEPAIERLAERLLGDGELPADEVHKALRAARRAIRAA